MVLVAVTSRGLLDALEVARNTDHAVWCGSDAISEVEYEALKGQNVTRFVYPLGGLDTEGLEDALSTVSEHHPTQSIWIESVAK